MENYVRLPLSFEQRHGGGAERYVAQGQGYTVGIERAKATIGVAAAGSGGKSSVVSLEFSGGRRARAVPGEQLPGKVNRLLGTDPSKWQMGLATYERVSYPGVYPGIDVVFYGNQQQLEFDLVVKPGADPAAIRMKVRGAGTLSIDPSGALNLGAPADGMRVTLPQIYQEVNGVRKNVQGKFALVSRDEVAFRVARWDRTKTLVIDPAIVYSALLGGGLGTNSGLAIGRDLAGNILIAGTTGAADFPTLNPAQAIRSGSTTDAFVSKINPSGTALLYSTYLGGVSAEQVGGLAVDPSGAVWIAGYTQSSDFPLLSAAQPIRGGGSYDAFVTKLSSTGGLQFSTYLGGSADDLAYGVAVDPSGNAYVTGYTNSAFPTTAGVVKTTAGGYDAFVTSYGPTGSRLYSTLLGGTTTDVGYGIAVDPAGNAYVTGYTYSTAFTGAPAGGAKTSAGGNQDGFVAKLNPGATALTYFTFLGGTGNDLGRAIAVDSLGNAYIAGQTASAGIATPGAAKTVLAGGADGFVAKLNAAGSAFTYLTYLGGIRSEQLMSLALDGSGSAYVTGVTGSPDFPTVSAFEPSYPGNGTALFQTSNSAASWTPFDVTLPGAAADLSLNPATGSAAVVSDTGFYRSINGGSTWTLQSPTVGSSGSAVLGRSPVTPARIYAAICCTVVYRSDDDGITWNFAGSTSSQPRGLVADPLDANTVYMYSFTAPYIFRSVNSGATWLPAASGLPGAGVVSMVASSNGSLYAATQGLGVYKSTDQAGSWNPIPALASTFSFTGSSLSASGNTIYFANFGLYKTTDGSNWLPAGTSSNLFGVVASPLNSSILYGLNGDNTIQASANGGVTWSSPGTGLPATFNASSSGNRIYPDPASSSRVIMVVPTNQTAVVAKLDSTGSTLLWSSYLGGPASATASSIATDGIGNILVAGTAAHQGFPITSEVLPFTRSGSLNAFFTRISDGTPACSTLTVSPGSGTAISQHGETVSLSVVAPSGCAWSASSNNAAAVIASGASGTGSGQITVVVGANTTGSTRTPVLTVGSQSIALVQPANTCTYATDKSSYPVPAGGGLISVVLSAPSGCPWKVINNHASAVTITSGATGTASGTISLGVAASTNPTSRTFTLPVGTISIQIVQAAVSLTPQISTTSVPGGMVGTYYATLLTASGGTAPYTWSLNSGSLPPGLTLNSATGVISGIPTTATGSPYTFTVLVTATAGGTGTRTLSIAVAPPATYPGQGEVIVTPRSPAALIFGFASNQAGFDTELTISNTTQDTSGSTPASGTCSISYYGVGAPATQTSASVPAGKQLVFTLSKGGGGLAGAPGFQGYVIANCSFGLARGTARSTSTTGITFSSDARLISVPRVVPSSQAFILPFVTNQSGFDAGIAISNTSVDPFGANGAVPTSGTCTLNFYGQGAPSPFTTPLIAPGTTYTTVLSAVAPGFQGYIAANCAFGAAVPFSFGISNPSGMSFGINPEFVALPRSAANQQLLFPSVTSQEGFDTGLSIANTSVDPFGASGMSPQSGTCTLNMYGNGAPAGPVTTATLAPGTVYTVVLSSLAPGFRGYVTASCSFAGARGFAFVVANPTKYSYSVTPELVTIPRSTATAPLLLPVVTNQNLLDTTVAISNTSLDPFGTSTASGACTLSYFGAMSSGLNPPSPQTSASIPAGGVLSFSLSQGNLAQGIAGAPGFRGYIIADCGSKLARGVAAIVGTPVVSTTSLPGGIVGVAYSQALAATNGRTPYSNWTVVSGTPPAGLTLNATTGTISGTPTSVASGPFAVTVKDASGQVSAPQSLTIAIDPPLNPPSIGSILHGADFSSPPLAPGSLATIFGSQLASTTASSPAATAPTTLAGVSVAINGIPAPLLFVSPGQINLQIPYSTTVGSKTVVVSNNGATSLSYSFSVVAASPGIFGNLTQNLSPAGLNAPANPIAPGGSAIVYFTGVGVVNPAVASGSVAPAAPLSVPLAATSVTVGGVPAAVSFVGLAPGTIGYAQANITVPNGLLAGSYPVVITSGGRPSQPSAIYVSGSAPVATSVTPNTAPMGSPATNINIAGSNFGGGATVRWTTPGGQNVTLSPTLIQAAQIAATVPLNLFTTAGTAQLAIISGLGTLSNQVPFTITPANSTTLTLGTSASPAVLGQNVTLTASVLPAAATGKVTFYDGTSILGIASLTSGQAVLTTRLLPSGSRRLKAYYAGAPGYAAATSLVVPHITNATPGTSFGPAVNFGVGTTPFSSVAGDFNGDGKIDIATANFGSSNVSVLLGDGFGGFGPPVNYGVGSNPVNVAATDFNGDGKTDLITSNINGANVSLLMGTGSGSFQSAVNYAAGSAPLGLTVADFNADGKADIGVASLAGNTVNVLLGNGDGSLQAFTSYSAFNGPNNVVAGDFNGDGKTDLVATNQNNTNAGVYLGNGDGTLQTATLFPISASLPQALAASDLNGDGKADLAVVAGSTLGVLFGNGNGTFQSPATYGGGVSVAVGDINGDGRADLVTTPGGAATVLLGNVDGSFQPGVNYAAGTNPRNVLVGDFNGDGRTDLVVTNNGSANVSVLLGAATGFSIASLTPNTAPAGSGQVTLTVAGANLATAAKVRWNSPSGTTQITPGLIAAAQISATIPASLLTTASTAQVAVMDAAGLVISNQLPFSITAPSVSPVISGMTNTALNLAAPPLAPGSLASIFGSSLATVQLANQSVSLPTSIAGVSVTVNGVKAPLAFVAPGQINLQIPYATPAGNVPVIVNNNGAVSNTFQLAITAVAPAVAGPGVLNGSDFSINSAAFPAPPGSTIIVYFTGVGQLNPAQSDGAAASQPYPVPVVTPSFTFNGTPIAPTFVGSAPATVGMLQANFIIPAGTPTANYPFVMTQSGKLASTVVYVGTSTAPVISPPANLGTFSRGTIQYGLGATGGNGTYAWSLTAGSLPPGLVLRTDTPTFFAPNQQAGLIGVATTVGTYNFTLTVTSDGQSASRAFTMRVTALNVRDVAVALPDAFVNTPFSYAFTAVGTAGPVTFTAQSTAGGVTINSAGILSGTPSTTGNYSTSFTLTDGTDTLTRGFGFTVYTVNITSPGVLPNATQNSSYSTSLTSSGGAGGYTYSLTQGSLPSGLTMTPAGAISGIPTSAGQSWFYVQSTDAGGNSYTKNLSIVVTGTPVAQASIGIYGNLDDAVIGNGYSRGVSVCCGGTAPFTWTATGLPAGMFIRSGRGIASNWVQAADAEIFGVPQAAGDYNVTVTAKDALNASVTKVFPFHVSQLDEDPYLPAGTVNTPYSTSLRTLGGTAPYGVQLIDGQLPAGLSLNPATLQVSGTPLESGFFSPILKFSDAAAHTFVRTFYFNINGPGNSTISINTGSNLGNAATGSSFSTQLSACCASSYIWSLAGGALPTGASLTSGGLISGTLTNTGSYSFLIKVADGANASNVALRQFKLVVSPTPLLIATNSLPNGSTTAAYTQTLTATGGSGALTWSLSPFNYLPPGLALASNGALTGTPTSAGFYFFTATVKDTSGNSASRSFSISVYGVNGPPLFISPNANLGTFSTGPIQYGLGATGGNGSYAWSLTGGSLPTGVALRTDTPSFFAPNQQAGLIGVATNIGNYSFTLTVTSAGQTVSRAFTMHVTALNVREQAVGLPDAFVNTPFSYAFTAVGSAGPVTFSVGSSAGGVVLSANGTLSGTPVAAGNYSLGFTLTDGIDTVSRSVAFNVYAVNITSPRLLPNATLNSPYTFTLASSGGTAPYTYQNTSFNLPQGLSLTSAGLISGTPTSIGQSAFWVKATDANGASYTKFFSIVVTSSPPSLPRVHAQGFNGFSNAGNVFAQGLEDGVIGGGFSRGISVLAGGAAPFTWNGVNIPAGLAMRSGGNIASSYISAADTQLWGIPQAGGDYSVKVTVTDATGVASSQVYPLHVSTMEEDYSAPSGTVNAPYSTKLKVIGGTAPYSAQVLDGRLPAGLSLNSSTLALAGTPLESGTFGFVLRYLDSTGQTLTRAHNLVISGGPNSTQSISDDGSLGTVIAGALYSKQFSVCCAAPYSWSQAGGNLPPGTGLSTSGLLSGTPSTPGTYVFLLKAANSADASNAAYRQFTLVVSSSPVLLTTSSLPPGALNSPYNQTITATGGTGSRTFSLALFNYLPPGLSLQPNGTLSGSPTSAGAYTFTVRASDSAGLTDSRIFTVNINTATVPSVAIEAPAANATLSGIAAITGWALENTVAVGPAAVSTVDVFVDGAKVGSAAYGGARPDICATYPGRPGCPNVGWTYDLDTKLLSTGVHSLKVTATDANGVSGSSTVVFNVTTVPYVYLDQPAANASLNGVVPVSGWALENLVTNGVAISKVEMFVDNVKVGTAVYGSSRTDVCASVNRPGCPNVGFSYSLDTGSLTGGTHVLKVVATDVNNVTGSTQIPFTSSGVLPHVVIDAPAADASLSGIVPISGWSLEGLASVGPSAIAKVEVFVDNVKVGTASSTPRPDVCAALPARLGCPNVGWSFNLNTTSLSNGPHVLKIVATDANSVTGSSQVSFTTAVPPFVSIDSPAANATLSGIVPISGWSLETLASVGPAAVNKVEVFVDGALVGAAVYGAARPDVCNALPGRLGCPNVGWNYNLNTGALLSGAHVLKIVATDTAGNTGSSQIAFQTALLPFVSIDSPAANANLSGTVLISGWSLESLTGVGPFAVNKVEVLVDGNKVGTATYGAARPDVCTALPGRLGCPNVGWSYNLDAAALAGGAHVLKVVATDTAGNTGFSQLNFSTPAAVPYVSIDLPAANAAVGGLTPVSGWALEGLAAAGTAVISKVEVFVDGVKAGNATYGGARADVCAALPGRPGCPNVGWGYVLDTTALTGGSHTMNVVATDANGLTGSKQISFTVASVLPYVSIDLPAANATLSGVAPVSGWALEGLTSVGASAITKVEIFVDNVLNGTATYGSSRSDVCTALPGRPGCPNVGWSYALNTIGLSAGGHVLKVVATDAVGTSGFSQINFSTASVVPFVSIDLPQPAATLAGSVLISGWSLEGLNSVGLAISTVDVYVDNVKVGTATYGSSRADVCTSLPGRPGCPNVGWSYTLNTTSLSSGSHVLKVVATDTAGGTGFSQITFSTASVLPYVSIDAPAANATLSGTAIVSGWALEGLTSAGPSVISTVDILVDGTKVGTATYGSSRADVCAALPGRPGCPNVGWTYSLNVTSLAAGSHVLKVVATDAAGVSNFNQISFNK